MCGPLRSQELAGKSGRLLGHSGHGKEGTVLITTSSGERHGREARATGRRTTPLRTRRSRCYAASCLFQTVRPVFGPATFYAWRGRRVPAAPLELPSPSAHSRTFYVRLVYPPPPHTRHLPPHVHVSLRHFCTPPSISHPPTNTHPTHTPHTPQPLHCTSQNAQRRLPPPSHPPIFSTSRHAPCRCCPRGGSRRGR